jgi:signal transduction histidine kinase
VPTDNQRDLAEAGYVNRQQIALAATRLQRFQEIMNLEASPETIGLVGLAGRFSRRPLSANQLATGQASSKAATPSTTGSMSNWLNRDVLLSACAPPQTLVPELNQSPQPLPQQFSGWPQPRVGQQQKRFLQQEDFAQQQALRNVDELQARAQSVQQAFDLNVRNFGANFPAPRANVAEGLLKPIWFGEALVLARRVSVQGRDYVQGCWLDWPNLRQWLLNGVKDLLPFASLEPIRNNGSDPRTRLLASLPMRLAPGTVPSSFGLSVSPVFFALLVAWACIGLATVAVVALLHGAITLSERRGAFVSAVTHELRTPLTTFKMYSEMLAEGMIAEPDKQRQYLATLCSEANRLSHLVENVLAYARLERGSARCPVEAVTLRQLIERVKERLAQRADQAGMRLVIEAAGESTLETVVHADVSAVEQILFNLVDNACKYAAPIASEKIIHLEALPDGRFAQLRVRDHGQGIPSEAAKRLFRPFSKSASEAARTAPGVGLGLALCHRLSRRMGGDLRLDQLIKNGACFVLTLPSNPPQGAAEND